MARVMRRRSEGEKVWQASVGGKVLAQGFGLGGRVCLEAAEWSGRRRYLEAVDWPGGGRYVNAVDWLDIQ